MKTDEAIKTDIYRHIKGSLLATSVTGIITKTKRPHGSKDEDIVISILANENGQLQTATANVNIYIADLLIKSQYEEDTKRIASISEIAANHFEVFRGDGWRARLLSQRVLAANGAEEHIINNKIEYKQINE